MMGVDKSCMFRNWSLVTSENGMTVAFSTYEQARTWQSSRRKLGRQRDHTILQGWCSRQRLWPSPFCLSGFWRFLYMTWDPLRVWNQQECLWHLFAKTVFRRRYKYHTLIPGHNVCQIYDVYNHTSSAWCFHRCLLLFMRLADFTAHTFRLSVVPESHRPRLYALFKGPSWETSPNRRTGFSILEETLETEDEVMSNPEQYFWAFTWCCLIYTWMFERGMIGRFSASLCGNECESSAPHRKTSLNILHFDRDQEFVTPDFIQSTVIRKQDVFFFVLSVIVLQEKAIFFGEGPLGVRYEKTFLKQETILEEITRLFKFHGGRHRGLLTCFIGHTMIPFELWQVFQTGDEQLHAVEHPLWEGGYGQEVCPLIDGRKICV